MMSSFKEFCDSGCCAQGGNDSFGGFGSPNFSSSFRPRRSLSFNQDQFQDVPSNFRNIGNFFQPSGTIRGIVHANLNGEVFGKVYGKIDGLPRLPGLLGCVGNLANLGNLGNVGLSLPLSIQFGDKTI